MSILSRNALKAEFISGTAATSDKFANVFDSTFNLNDDSLLIGPTGITGSYGLWFNIIGATPISLSSTGSTGQIAASSEGFWVCIEQDSWVFVPTTYPIGGTVTGHLIPDTDITYDLGSTGYRFKDLYISGTTIYIGDSTISTDDQGNFIFNGPIGGTVIIGPSGLGFDPDAVSLTYGSGPAGPTAPGATGQMIMETIIGASPEIGNLYIYDPTQTRWVKFIGAAFDW